MRRAPIVLLVLLGLLAGCGEPDVDLQLPQRAQGQQVLDQAEILEEGELEGQLDGLRQRGHDVVAVTFESPEASAGHADRSGRMVLEEWGADVVLIAVAVPGDFTSTEGERRRRFFGVVPADRFLVSGDVREMIVEELAPPLAADNDWDAVFAVAVEAISRELPDES
jgi:hypothetical protein